MGTVVKLKDEKRKGRAKGGGGGAPPKSELDKKIAELNKQFAVVLVGDKALILREYMTPRRRDVIGFLTVAALRTYMERYQWYDANLDREVGLADLWLRHADRRTYDGIDFAPDNDIPENWYNLWRGFAVEAAAPYDDWRQHARHFPTFYDHMLTNVARGDAHLARWIWGWFASLIQHPTERIGTALVLRGKQGVGKTKPGEVIGSLLGAHWALVDSPKLLTGDFNAHMMSCLLLQADEGFWAGDKGAEGRLKSLITSPVHYIEKKGVDAEAMRNLVRLLVTSNSDWVVPAGFEERRFACADVGEGRIQDKVYFARIDQEMNEGGREHLLAYLQRFDLSKVDVRTIPQTEALFEQKVATMSELQSWWMDRLREGRLLAQHGDWKDMVLVDPLYRSYVDTADRIGKARRLSKEQFGMALRKMVPKDGIRATKMWVNEFGPDGETIHNSDGSAAKKRQPAYKMAGLDPCRAHFSQLLGWRDINWDGEGEAEKGAAAPELPLSGRGQGERDGFGLGEDWES